MQKLLGGLLLLVGLGFGYITPQIGVSYPVQVGDAVSDFNFDAVPAIGISLEQPITQAFGGVISAAYVPYARDIASFEAFAIPMSLGIRSHLDMFIIGGGAGYTIFDVKDEAFTAYLETGMSDSNLEWICRYEAINGDARLYSLFGLKL